MLKTMLRPFFKRFLGLFFSMAFVSMLSIAMLCTFGSSIVNLEHSYGTFLNDYGKVDEQISIKSFADRADLLETASIPEVEYADTRLTIDTFLQKEEGRHIVARVFSYNEQENMVFKRYVVEQTTRSDTMVNISIAKKMATNNGFAVGSTIKMGYFGLYANFFVSEIVDTSEGIYPRANDYIWSDNQDFGYIYVDELELNKGLKIIADLILAELDSNPEFKEIYEKTITTLGMIIPDLREVGTNFATRVANQLLVRNQQGQDQETVKNKIVENINAKGMAVKSATIGDHLPYRAYMNNAMKQLRVASLFLPIFFYSVTMIVIGLFMNQIVKSMTSQIGVLVSIGIDKREIVLLFMVYGFFMALLAGIVGVPVGYGLNILLSSIMINTYSIPTITAFINTGIAALAIGVLIVAAEIATFLSCLAIFRITPKDAVISNEAKRKPIPKWLNKVIDKAPMNIKLGVNSVAQNPKRFFVSTFSILASLVLITLSTFFYVSKEEMIGQSVDRRLNYDCQVYLAQKEEQSFIDELRIQEFVKKDEQGTPEFEDCYYFYFEAKSTKAENSIYLECLAAEPGLKPLINIPTETGYGTLPICETGIILPKSDATRLGVWKGDTINLGGTDVVVADISFQYFHPMTYLSKTQMESIGGSYVSSLIMNITDETAFLNYMSENKNECITVFTRSLSKDLHAIFDAINVFIFLMVGFSLGMSFVILSIMSQNALMEQQRPLSVFRAVGFTVLDISNIWTLQSVSQLLFAVIFAAPAGTGAAMLLFHMASSPTQTYPFIFSFPMFAMAVGFVLLVIIACHLISMFAIRRWNLADNTRCRE